MAKTDALLTSNSYVNLLRLKKQDYRLNFQISNTILKYTLIPQKHLGGSGVTIDAVFS